MTWEKWSIAIVIVVVIATSAALRSRAAKIRDLERQIQQRTTKIADRSQANELEVQAECAAQARRTYLDLGYPKGTMAGYSTNYNIQLHRCFIHIVSSRKEKASGAFWTHRYVLDPLRGQEYATYTGRTGPSNALQPLPARCDVTLPSGEMRTCHSEEEFTELVNVYMEEN